MNVPTVPRRSVLPDARRRPFFSSLLAPVNRDNLHFDQQSAMHDSPKNVRDVEQAGLERDLPLEHDNDGAGGTNDCKGKQSVGGNLPPASSGDNGDTASNSELLSDWQQRLQYLTLVTTFLASMDGGLFSLTVLPTNISQPASTASREVIYSCLAGALIFHICATILGYIASFALIRYRIVDVSSEEDVKLGGVPSSPPSLSTTQLAQRVPRKIVLEPIHPAHCIVTFLQRPVSERFRLVSSPQSVSPRSSPPPPPPLSLLTRCSYVCLGRPENTSWYFFNCVSWHWHWGRDLGDFYVDVH
ncbi:hypothetical protein BS17DRAFT_809515 [Gyrodon lividus]|nr:hypothetical protein BS17DRAFT_809515 [Gyrodon lividus]